MYEYIKGKIDQIGPEYIVLENNGVGYQILTPNPFAFSKKQDADTIVYTYQHVREDLIALYGFLTFEEKVMFRKLLNVSGIGPKGALAILAYGDPAQVIQAIENEDEKFLVKFPGVGKKTARQMILDLKGKLNDVAAFPEVAITAERNDLFADEGEGELQEALLALAALGYSERELSKIKPKLTEKGLTTDQYIKQALQYLMT